MMATRVRGTPAVVFRVFERASLALRLTIMATRLLVSFENIRSCAGVVAYNATKFGVVRRPNIIHTTWFYPTIHDRREYISTNLKFY